MIWLHGFGEDEQSFLHHVAPQIDAAICSGKLPPFLVVAPDGSLIGEPDACSPGSFFLNTRAGSFEDFVLRDCPGTSSYRALCHCAWPGAHILAGASMGGFAAYNYAIKHRNAFGVVAGIFPPLNLHLGWTTRAITSPISIPATGAGAPT